LYYLTITTEKLNFVDDLAYRDDDSVECTRCAGVFHLTCVALTDYYDESRFICHECIDREDIQMDWDSELTARYGEGSLSKLLPITTHDLNALHIATREKTVTVAVLKKWEGRLRLRAPTNRRARPQGGTVKAAPKKAIPRPVRKVKKTAPPPIPRAALEEVNSPVKLRKSSNKR
jgi:hypothetical protein